MGNVGVEAVVQSQSKICVLVCSEFYFDVVLSEFRSSGYMIFQEWLGCLRGSFVVRGIGIYVAH